MTIDELNVQLSADIGGPSIGAWPTTYGEKMRPHKGGGKSSSTSTQEIPRELKPLANAYVSKAMGLGSQGYNPYSGDRFEDLNSTQLQALEMMKQRATGGSQTVNNAESALNQIIQGGNTNPYLDQMVSRAQDSVRSQFNTGAVNSGSFGNSGLQEQFQRGLSDTATQMYGQAYDADRARQMQGIGMAQQFGNQAYQDANQLLSAGQVYQDQAQQDKDFAYQQYQEAQDLPYKQLAAMSGIFSSNLGGSTTTTQKGGGGK